MSISEYEDALLTAENHGLAHEFLRQGRLAEAVASMDKLFDSFHRSLSGMDRQKIILEVLSGWQGTFDRQQTLIALGEI